MKGPYLIILSLFLYDVNCSTDSLQATILIFYLYFFTLIFFLFVKFIFYFEEFRIANRINLAPGENVFQVEKKLIKLTPKEFLQDAHHLLIQGRAKMPLP